VKKARLQLNSLRKRLKQLKRSVSNGTD
jgi:hypothetical protein